MSTAVHPMLEKVARAIEPHFSAADKAYGKHFDAARAAVQALMEPTQDMIDNSFDLETREERRRAIYVMTLRPLVEGEGG